VVEDSGWRATRWLAGSAITWGLLLILLAVVLPVQTVASDHAGRQPMRSLTAVNGYGVLGLVCVPLVVAVLVTALLRVSVVRSRSRWGLLAWALSGLLLISAGIGFVTFLIGIYVVPMGALLLAACAQARPLGRVATSGVVSASG
jgi:hypothetical protein